MSERIRNSGIYQRITSSTNELERLFHEVDEQKNPPDIKKVLLLMGLGTLSWVSTYSGLLELIKANSGDIAFTYKLAIGFAVAMLMLMIVYILDQLFAPLNWLLRTIYIFGYIFLTLISVGFGFGFYWKFLESRSEATRSAESAITQVQSALQGGQTRLEQLEQTLTSLTALSLLKAKEEREKGNSCPNSRPGDGPRRRLRDNDAKNFSFAGDFITKRAQSVADDIKKLNGDMVKIASRHPSTVDPKTGTRNAFMKKLSQQLELTITRFNAFRTDPQLTAIRNNLAERANTTTFPLDGAGTFPCPDPQLQGALRGVVLAIDQLPILKKPVIKASEGSEATIEAFSRLGATLSGLLVFKLPPSEDELRELRKKAVRSIDQKQTGPELNAIHPGLNERDYIPLAIAVFVDFCLLLVSINRPMDRLKSLVPVMKEARDGPISGILSSFHATHFAGIREEFSLFQHVVFDWGGHYYVAVPLASNDIQAQYLANLFVSLEGRGIVDRAMIPPAFIIRSKLKKMGSSFADHQAFRLYKFRNGAWSNIVMDAVMGAAKEVSITQAAEAKAMEKQKQQLEQSQFTSFQNDEGSVLDHEREKGANFASLFDSEMKTVNGAQHLEGEDHAALHHHHPVMNGHHTPITHAHMSEAIREENEPGLEMPRLLKKESEKQQEARGKIIKPAHFSKTRFTKSPSTRAFAPLKPPAGNHAPINQKAGAPEREEKQIVTNFYQPREQAPQQQGRVQHRLPPNHLALKATEDFVKREEDIGKRNDEINGMATADKQAPLHPSAPKGKNADQTDTAKKTTAKLGEAETTVDTSLTVEKSITAEKPLPLKESIKKADKDVTTEEAVVQNVSIEKNQPITEEKEQETSAPIKPSSLKPAPHKKEEAVVGKEALPAEDVASLKQTPPPLPPMKFQGPKQTFQKPEMPNKKASDIAVGKITNWFAGNNQQGVKNNIQDKDSHNQTKETS